MFPVVAHAGDDRGPRPELLDFLKDEFMKAYLERVVISRHGDDLKFQLHTRDASFARVLMPGLPFMEDRRLVRSFSAALVDWLPEIGQMLIDAGFDTPASRRQGCDWKIDVIRSSSF